MVGALLTAMGAAFIVVGLVRVIDSLTLAETIAYIVSGGIGGVAMLGSGMAFLSSAQLRRQWDSIDHLRAELRVRNLMTAPEKIETGGSNGLGAEPRTGIRA